MEPCQFCGQHAAVDGAGFCTNCRNYRGVPAQSGPTYPQPVDPYGGPVYPTSAPSYGGQVSAPPVTGAPYSAPPGGYPAQQYSAPPATYQQSAPPYQQSAPPYQPVTGVPAGPPPKQRSGFVVPIIALCSVMVLLVVGIVIVVVVKNKPSGSGGTTGLTASGLDKCLVGTWKTTASTIQVPVDGVGEVAFTLDSSSNYTTTTDETGHSVDNFGTADNPTKFIATAGGDDYQYLEWGTFTYTLKSANGVLSFEDGAGDGEYTWVVNGDRQDPTPLSNDEGDPTPYTCTSTTLTQTTGTFTGVATRQ